MAIDNNLGVLKSLSTCMPSLIWHIQLVVGQLSKSMTIKRAKSRICSQRAFRLFLSLSFNLTLYLYYRDVPLSQKGSECWKVCWHFWERGWSLTVSDFTDRLRAFCPHHWLILIQRYRYRLSQRDILLAWKKRCFLQFLHFPHLM